MIEIDFLKVAQAMEQQGVRGRILPLVKKAAKNIAAGRPFRLVNLPGEIMEVDGVKHIVTKKGRLCRI